MKLSSQTLKDMEENLITLNTPIDKTMKQLYLYVNVTLDIKNISRIIDEKRKISIIK